MRNLLFFFWSSDEGFLKKWSKERKILKISRRFSKEMILRRKLLKIFTVKDLMKIFFMILNNFLSMKTIRFLIKTDISWRSSLKIFLRFHFSKDLQWRSASYLEKRFDNFSLTDPSFWVIIKQTKKEEILVFHQRRNAHYLFFYSKTFFTFTILKKKRLHLK